MYSSHLNFIFSLVCYIFYMLLVTSKYGITVATVLQEQFGTCNDHLNLQCLRLMIHVCTDHTQVQELHLKNQLNRGYNKLSIKKKSYKKLIKPFSSIKSSKNWTIVKYLYNSYPRVLIIILVNTILRHLYTYHVLLCLDTLYIQVLKTY